MSGQRFGWRPDDRQAGGGCRISLWAASVVFAAHAIVASPSFVPEAAADAATGVTVRDLGSVAIVEATLPGRVLDHVPACTTATRCEGLLLLVRPGEGDATPVAPEAAGDASGAGDERPSLPPLLLHLDLTAALAGRPAAALTQPTLWVPHEASALALLDLDGDGESEVAAGETGRLWSLGPPDALEVPLPVLHGEAVDLAAVRSLLDPRLARFPTAEVGRLRWYAPVDGKLAPAGSAALPVQARRRGGGLELSSPEPLPMSGPGGGAPSWVAGPEAHGDRRLRSVLIDPAAPDGAAAEAWALLPGPERVASAQYVRIDGRPALVVFTHGADKLRLFDQKRVRVFFLATDRTRAGSTPALAAETRSHLWQDAEAAVADFDGDGHEDVAVAQVKGMFDGEAVEVDTYRGLGGGRFESRPRQVRLKLDAPDWRWTGDLDGDRLPDLVATTGDDLVVFTGAGRRRGAALNDEPAWRLSFPPQARPGSPERVTEGEAAPEAPEVEVEVRAGSDGGTEIEARREDVAALGTLPRAVDLDGDGRPELVSTVPLPDGRERLRVIVLRPRR